MPRQRESKPDPLHKDALDAIAAAQELVLVMQRRRGSTDNLRAVHARFNTVSGKSFDNMTELMRFWCAFRDLKVDATVSATKATAALFASDLEKIIAGQPVDAQRMDKLKLVCIRLSDRALQ